MKPEVLHSAVLVQHPALTNAQLAIVTLARLALNIAYRIIYPLLPFLALHLHMDLRTISALVTIQVLTLIISPLGGTLADMRGERTGMLCGLALFCLGTALCVLSATFVGFLAGYMLIGLSVALYQPAVQAYLSARTPYVRRGWALGVLETSWAASALLGVAPLMLLVQATGDVKSVFWVLLIAGTISLVMIQITLPSVPRRTNVVRQRIDWRTLRTPSVAAVLGMLMLCMGAIDMILVVQGAWLQTRFGANEAQLGQVFGMLGIAELIGSLGTTLLVDRIGKKPSVVGGFVLTALCMATLPLSEGRWLLFLPLFFLFDLFFEFSIVATFPLISGIAPEVRGTLMALGIAVIGLGRAAGSLVSQPLWSRFGITANALLGAGLILAGVLLCVVFVREAEVIGDKVTR